MGSVVFLPDDFILVPAIKIFIADFQFYKLLIELFELRLIVVNP